MKKDFCIDCKHPLVRNLAKGRTNSAADKTCKGCTRIPASRVPTRRRSGKR